jgi:hypothetical protein
VDHQAQQVLMVLMELMAQLVQQQASELQQ